MAALSLRALDPAALARLGVGAGRGRSFQARRRVLDARREPGRLGSAGPRRELERAVGAGAVSEREYDVREMERRRARNRSGRFHRAAEGPVGGDLVRGRAAVTPDAARAAGVGASAVSRRNHPSDDDAATTAGPAIARAGSLHSPAAAATSTPRRETDGSFRAAAASHSRDLLPGADLHGHHRHESAGAGTTAPSAEAEA